MTKVFVLNGWAASPHAWDLCSFRRDAVFSYVDQLDGAPEKAMQAADGFIIVGWSMGGSSALRLAAALPGKVRGLVLIAATPRMMEDPASGWRGMNERRLAALKKGLMITGGGGLFGIPDGKPNPYLLDDEKNLDRGLDYLLATDVRQELLDCALLRSKGAAVRIFQSERDGIVKSENAAFLQCVFHGATVEMIPGVEHALPIMIPEKIDAAVNELLRLADTP